MHCKQEVSNCLPALIPWHNLSILVKGKIAAAAILPHAAKYTLLSSFRSVNRNRSVNFQWTPEQELESLFGAGAEVKKTPPTTSAVDITGSGPRRVLKSPPVEAPGLCETPGAPDFASNREKGRFR